MSIILASLTATTLQVWEGDTLLQWSPATDDMDRDAALAGMGYARFTEWEPSSTTLVARVAPLG